MEGGRSVISEDLLVRYNMGNIEDYEALAGSKEKGKYDFYRTYLIQTDYVPNKIIEAQAMGEQVDQDYTEILQARAYAREQISFMDSKKE